MEVRKSLLHEGPEIMWETFVQKPQSYNLRRANSFVIPKARTTFDQNCFDFRASLAWNNLPVALATETSLNKFKTELKNTKIYCKCKACS